MNDNDNPNYDLMTELIVIMAHDLPIWQWRDTLAWWLDGAPERVLQPAVKWTCSERAHELCDLQHGRNDDGMGDL